ncbi:MAG: aromatic ring-hydroxylating oxygenase subunit alpha [Alphaproteobacteria bacterium]
MVDIVTHPLAIDGKDPRNLRGDPIDPERYYTRDFMEREWEHMWTKVWHIAGREKQLQEPGDYITHDFMHETVFIVKQKDGSLKGFYNVCSHRAQRLVWGLEGSQEEFACPYHGWKFDLEGTLTYVEDPDDYPGGDPCGKANLIEVRVDTWGSLIWYTMDDEAPALHDYLHPIPELYKNHMFDRTVRARWVRVELDCNWKFWCDNFNESYHTRTAHQQVPPIIDQDHFTSRYEMYPMGHNRIVQMGRPSLRDRLPEGAEQPFDDLLRTWDIDPDSYPDFETKVMQGWLDLKEAKKTKWKEKGYLHYENLNDEELTESPFQFVFPNIAFGPSADGFGLFRWEPHRDDPEKCYFDYWTMTYPVEGQDSYTHRTSADPLETKEAEFELRDYDGGKGVQDLKGEVVYQDWGLMPGQKDGWRSRGYQEPLMAKQESRVRRFHEVLNDYLAGNPPGR